MSENRSLELYLWPTVEITSNDVMFMWNQPRTTAGSVGRRTPL